MITVPAEDGVYTGIPDTVYHADRGSLSSSGARALLRPQCPAIFAHEQANPRDPKAQYDFGHAAHKYLLGVGEEIVEVQADNWMTKDAKTARREAWDEGKVPLLTKDVLKAQEMAKRATEHPWVASLLSAGEPEVSGYWRDPETGVRLRLRTDWLHPGVDQLIVGDYKTTTSANPNTFAKSCGDYGYHQQVAWYLDGLAALGVAADAGYDDTETGFLFIFQSKEPPYLTSVGELDAADIERGRRLNRKAINTYAECIRTNQWPDFGDGIHRLSIRSYQRYQEEEFLA